MTKTRKKKRTRPRRNDVLGKKNTRALAGRKDGGTERSVGHVTPADRVSEQERRTWERLRGQETSQTWATTWREGAKKKKPKKIPTL